MKRWRATEKADDSRQHDADPSTHHRARMHRPPRVRASAGISSLVLTALLLAGCLHAVRPDSIDIGEWPSYGNDAGGTRYSPLTQIDRGNVTNLKIAWTYRTGEVGGVAPSGHTAFEATPLMVDGMLFLSTPYNRVIALDPEIGEKRWSYDPKVDRARRFALITSRGVATWLDTYARADRVCRRRVFVATIDARLGGRIYRILHGAFSVMD
jgi:glucose dehydrogenase